MSHVRTQIRTALREVMSEIGGLSGQIVFDETEIVSAPDAPWVHVVLGPEAIAPMTLGRAQEGRTLTRSTQLIVDVYARGRSEAIELAESTAAQVQAKLFDNATLGGLIRGLTPVGLQPNKDASGSLPIQMIRSTWTFNYGTSERDSTTAK